MKFSSQGCRAGSVFGLLLFGMVFNCMAVEGTVVIQKISDSIVDEEALIFPDGPFGTCINGQTFQQDGVTSFNGYQYAAFFGKGGIVCLGRRPLPDGKWEVLRLKDYVIADHRDVHNVVVVGICPGDGTIHLSFDHHSHPLHYRKSVPKLALEPKAFAWKSSLFGKTVSELEAGKPLKKVTYPQFVSTSKGTLQLLYRLLGSGNGDWYLAEYNPASGKWRTLGMLFSRKGQYQTSASRCAYPNQLRYDHKDRLHAAWCWRERPSNGIRDLSTNHDVHYAFSDDFGRTWKNNQSEVVGILDHSNKRPSKPIDINSPGIVVRKTKYLWGQMNTTTQYNDHRGRVHVVNWQNPSDAPGKSLDMNTWRYFHYWRGSDGKWNEYQLPFSGRKPQILVDSRGTAFLVFCQGKDHNYHKYDRGGQLCIAKATEGSQWKDWIIIHRENRYFVGEPLVDMVRWAKEGVLSVYMQERPVKAGVPSKLHVLDYKPALNKNQTASAKPSQ